MTNDKRLEDRAVALVIEHQEKMEEETGVVPDQLIAAMAVIEMLLTKLGATHETLDTTGR